MVIQVLMECFCVVFKAAMTPEIIPPVTHVVTYSKSSKPIKARGTVGGSETTATTTVVQSSTGSRGWTGGEFKPSQPLVQLQQQPQHSAGYSGRGGGDNRTKRYSSQRQRGPGDGGPDIEITTPIVSLGSIMSVGPGPLLPPPPAAFYGM